MPRCYYTCNLLPLDLVVHSGYSPRWLGNYLRDPSAPARRDALGVHPMTCPFVTKLVAAAEEVLADKSAGAARPAAPAEDAGGGGAAAHISEADCVVVPGGCDAMRRLGDLLAATYPDKVFVLPMPRSSGEAVTATLAADLARLERWLKARLSAGATSRDAAAAGPGEDAAPGEARRGGASPTAAVALGRPAVSEPPTVDYPTPPRPGGVFLVAGPLSDDSLLGLVGKLGAHVSGLESCTSPDRWKPLAPGAAEAPSASGKPARGGADAEDTSASPDYGALAAHLLATGMCPRRSTADRREHLARRLDDTRASSIIYARQSFCDPGAYDALLVAQLAAERELPYLEIEVDFPFDANGPLRTRVEAFLEAQLLDDALLDGDDLFDDEPLDAEPVDAGVPVTGAVDTPATDAPSAAGGASNSDAKVA